jgi:thiamine-phosphate pyrophosphorylase
MRWPPLYAIVDQDTAACHGWTVPALGRAYLEAGARMLQVRAPRATSRELLYWCDTLVDVARETNACVIVNDRTDIARLSAAAGVHLGQQDVTVAAARRQLGDEALIGVSTHTVEQADAARTETVDYVAVGPVYATSTKRTGYAAVGLDMVSYAAARGDAPIVAIGGVTLARAPAVISAGATSVAVVSDLLTGGDPRRCVRDYARALEK